MVISNDILLRINDLQTVFHAREGVVRAVRGVSFEVRRGEKVGIVGESGSGKSALALSILRLISPPGEIVSGQVWLNDQDLMATSERDMQRVRGSEIALIFQDPMTALDPVMTIGAQIVESIRRHQPDVRRREARDRAIELLRDVEVPLPERRVDDYPHQLSGGMRQRVVIAIALANDPSLVIADEPTTALDVTTQAQVLDVLERAVEERGAAVILITHNLGIVADFCDSVKVMYAGRLVEHAAPTDLFRKPVHPYSEALLRSILDPAKLEEGPLPTIPGAPPSLANLPASCAFEPRCPLGCGVDICQKIAPPMVWIGPVAAECHFAAERWTGSESIGKEPAADGRA